MKEKEQLFTRYLEITQQAVASDDPESIEGYIIQRESLISQINDWDDQRGKVETNPQILEMINAIRSLDAELRSKIEFYKKDALSKLQALKNGQMLKNQYSQGYSNTDGVFYDKRK